MGAVYCYAGFLIPVEILYSNRLKVGSVMVCFYSALIKNFVFRTLIYCHLSHFQCLVCYVRFHLYPSPLPSPDFCCLPVCDVLCGAQVGTRTSLLMRGCTSCSCGWTVFADILCCPCRRSFSTSSHAQTTR